MRGARYAAINSGYPRAAAATDERHVGSVRCPPAADFRGNKPDPRAARRGNRGTSSANIFAVKHMAMTAALSCHFSRRGYFSAR